jgi:hypothetical protein
MNWNLTRQLKSVALNTGRSAFRFTIPELQLHDGCYRWALWIGQAGSIEANLYAVRAGSFMVTSDFKSLSGIPYLPFPSKFEIEQVES